MTSGNPQPSPEEQFITKIVNAVIRVAPVGGSGWVMVHFLLQQNWVLAGLMFPVMVATAAWAKFTSGFINISGAGAEAYGARKAQGLTTWLDQQNQKLEWRFANTEKKYLQCQAKTVEEYTTEGLSAPQSGKFTLLKDVYVPLKLSDRFRPGAAQLVSEDLEGPTGNLGKPEDEEPSYIWELLAASKQEPTYRRLAIVAPGGYGKTTLMRHVAYCCGMAPRKTSKEKQVPRLVPFVLYLRNCRELMASDEPPDLPTLIAEHQIPSLSRGRQLGITPDWVEEVLGNGRSLVVFDGFDEVAEDQKQAVSAWIDRALLDYSDTVRFIMTSRPPGFERFKGQQPWTRVDVQEFDDEQRSDFLRSWYYCQVRERRGQSTPEVRAKATEEADKLIAQIEQRHELRTMAGNPLMLCIIATFHRYSASPKLPRRRTDLYQRFFQLLLEDRPAVKDQEMSLSCEESQSVLQHIALEMVKQGCNAISIDEFSSLAAQYLKVEIEEPVEVADFLHQMEEISQLLVKRESAETYEFSHRSFQEYLAAKEVKKLGCEALLLDLPEEWRSVVLMYAALTDPTTLMESLMQQGGKTSLNLAYDCWCENRKKVSEDVIAALQEQSYQLLERYMAAGEWRKADQYTLQVMYQAIRVDSGAIGALFSSLLTFPCGPLLRLDGLWLRYSHGKFGFSVQKNIYLKCGGIADGKYHKEAYQRYCHKVEWMKDGSYQPYKNFIFSWEEAPEGHLPGYGDVGGSALSSLASRLVNCNT